MKTRIVFIEKGGDVRGRLAVQQFANGEGVGARDDLLARTPPLVVARLLVSQASSCPDKRLTLDISCVLLYAPVKRTLYTELPKEDGQSGGWEVGQLERRCTRQGMRYPGVTGVRS